MAASKLVGLDIKVSSMIHNGSRCSSYHELKRISTVCHLYFSKIRSEMILSHWWSRNTFVFSMSVEKFDHTRIVSDTSFLILKCNQCLFFHQIADADPPKIVSEYDQEIPQSQTADNPVAPRGRAAQPSRDTRKTN